MNARTVQRLITIITYTERPATLAAVEQFLRARQYRHGIADPDVLMLRDMAKARKAELA